MLKTIDFLPADYHKEMPLFLNKLLLPGQEFQYLIPVF